MGFWGLSRIYFNSFFTFQFSFLHLNFLNFPFLFKNWLFHKFRNLILIKLFYFLPFLNLIVVKQPFLKYNMFFQVISAKNDGFTMKISPLQTGLCVSYPWLPFSELPSESFDTALDHHTFCVALQNSVFRLRCLNFSRCDIKNLNLCNTIENWF